MLHFAYGSNMSRALMEARCPTARALGIGTLPQWRFVICPDGFASVMRVPGERVYGVLWKVMPRDLAAINAYENVEGGLYLQRRLPVHYGGQRASALVYVARRQGEGMPRPGYMSVVLNAAVDWSLPPAYIDSIARLARTRWPGARAKETGGVG